ncbi:unnamed protein product, partial [Chrysoparadoxa australica]
MGVPSPEEKKQLQRALRPFALWAKPMMAPAREYTPKKKAFAKGVAELAEAEEGELLRNATNAFGAAIALQGCWLALLQRLMKFAAQHKQRIGEGCGILITADTRQESAGN